MSEKPAINYQRWAKNAVTQGLEQLFKEWSGGWPCPIATSPPAIDFSEGQAILKRAVDFVDTNDPFGDVFSLHDRKVLAAFASEWLPLPPPAREPLSREEALRRKVDRIHYAMELFWQYPPRKRGRT